MIIITIIIHDTIYKFSFCISETSGCKTIAGPSKGKDCVFPFVFNGKKYNECAFDSDGFWCSTKVDSTGTHITGNWGICGSDCPKGKKTLK